MLITIVVAGVLRNEKKRHEPVEVPETTSGSSQEVWVSA